MTTSTLMLYLNDPDLLPKVDYSFLPVSDLIKIADGSVSCKQELRDLGIAYIVHYPNGCGVDIVKDPFSHGNSDNLWEIAVLGDVPTDEDDCPITSYDDVVGFLSDEEVVTFCNNVRNLKPSRR